uniref:Transmembrane protein n=1 Tax=Noctiluca scintillans TaxID=2966 RepID=A0A7S1FFG0_NOCSC|eukprot:CAMPEP_0194496584 /NCGR_PEP_ID=MMETSP0253-20130528/13812_1 /TAXON_ID=2966 /ORGANISM="Noctiluca scintillans" /LENGTH=116 /DNA_ID=CAMNT_0039338003 /DNA_START=22 /DNA_END=372 /DNA_ORIENTATION=+
MAAKLEGTKPSFVSRLGTGILSRCRVGTPIYSLAYGVAGGVILSGLVLAGRTLHVAFFDHDYYKLQSRKRYYEKQLLFTREQEEAATAHYIAALASEYDPVATRMPFKPLDPKYRF